MRTPVRSAVTVPSRPRIDVPRQLADLTPDWLGHALGAEVTSADVTSIAEREGFMGRLARVVPTYAGGSSAGPASLVAKIPTDEPGSVMLGQMLRVWEREACFSTELAPKLGVRTARCHYPGGDEESGIFAVLLEDLSTCAGGDQIKGATPEQTTPPGSTGCPTRPSPSRAAATPPGNEVVAIDWQSVCFGEGLYDVAYFLCGSIDTDLRRSIEQDAVATYGRTLRDHGVDVPGDDELFDLYRQSVLMAMTVGALLMGRLDLTVNQRAVDLARLGVERLYTAGADLKVGDFAQ